MADDTETQRVGIRPRDKIVNARRQAGLVAAALVGAECGIDHGFAGAHASGTAIIYKHDGRVYHLVVYDMGEAKP